MRWGRYLLAWPSCSGTLAPVYAHCLLLKLAIRAMAMYFNGVQMWTMYLYSLRHGTLDSDLLNISEWTHTARSLLLVYRTERIRQRNGKGLSPRHHVGRGTHTGRLQNGRREIG